jgi:hypothetical protein
VQLKIAALSLLCALAACRGVTAQQDPPGVARIAHGVSLVLPAPPGFPQPRRFDQMVTASFGKRELVFESFVDLGPEAVLVAITAPNGPRLATIDWTKAGIKGDRAASIPAELREENLLADMMLVYWPAQAIEAAMRPDGVVVDHADGSRTISSGGRAIVEVRRLAATEGVERRVLTNSDLHYTLALSTTSGED